VTGSRRFSQAISEGDGISLVAAVGAPDEARTAEGAGAEAVLVWSGRERDLRAIRAATSLPILFYWDGEHAAALEGAACLVEARGERDRDLVEHAHLELADRFELALQIEDEEHLAAALEDFDPAVFVLAAREDGEEAPLEQVLDLLPDVPAGKLAIAQLPSLSADDVAALERAGVDAVIVGAGDVAELAGDVARPV